VVARPIAVCTLSSIAVLLIAGALASTKQATTAVKHKASPRRPGPSSVKPPVLYTAAKHYDPFAWIHGEDRFREGATVFIRDASGQHPLVADFAASADPSVSFDGRHVLFAGKKKAQDHWQIWETALAERAPRRVTSCPDDCVRPFYLPEDRIVYAKKSANRFVVEAAPLAGGSTLQLTYAVGSALPTDVLRDGRILFQSMSPFGTGGLPEIYTVYSDGSGVESYRCDHGKARYSGKQVSSGDIVFVSASGLGRFTSALAHEVRIAAPAGDYAGDVAEIPSGDWLVSWRRDARSPFQLMRWKPVTEPNEAGVTKASAKTSARKTNAPAKHDVRNSSASATGDLRPVFDEPGVNILQPTLIVERSAPNRHPSGLHDWPNANLLCLNAYTSKFKFIDGSIHSVRLYTRDTRGAAKLLGSAPVERDGSFFIQVPTEQPLQMELLDASGKILKRQSGWFWMRRGEQRACVGCHAGPETAPENAVPMILLKSTTPADLTGASTHDDSGGH